MKLLKKIFMMNLVLANMIFLSSCFLNDDKKEDPKFCQMQVANDTNYPLSNLKIGSISFATIAAWQRSPATQVPVGLSVVETWTWNLVNYTQTVKIDVGNIIAHYNGYNTYWIEDVK